MFDELLIPFLFAMFLSVTMGGSGTAPAFSAAFGAGLIRKDMIAGIFGVMVFMGAIFMGEGVTTTMGKGFVPTEYMTITATSIILISVALSIFFANLLGIPQSTSQSAVAALTATAHYLDVLDTEKLFFEIIPTWFLLPIIAFVLMFVLAKLIYKPLKNYNLIRFEELGTHPILKYVVIVSSCYVAFAIGTNNVANAAGPIAAMVMNKLQISANDENYKLVVLMSMLVMAPCFGIGSSFFGAKLVKTSGKDIIEIGPLGASVVSGITATLLIAASIIKGIPTSLVQLNVAAIIALGISKVGLRHILKDKTVQRFWVVWIIAPVFAFGMAFFLTWIADSMGLLRSF